MNKTQIRIFVELNVVRIFGGNPISQKHIIFHIKYYFNEQTVTLGRLLSITHFENGGFVQKLKR